MFPPTSTSSHGDRSYADDKAIVGGLARFNGQACVVIGHQKAATPRKRSRATGMHAPRGLPQGDAPDEDGGEVCAACVHLHDTPGAYPGIGAEERGQSEAIGHSIYLMAELKTPIISTIIGEGGSGGAPAIAVADRVLMLHVHLLVISPEGCAPSCGRAEKADAAETMASPRRG